MLDVPHGCAFRPTLVLSTRHTFDIRFSQCHSYALRVNTSRVPPSLLSGQVADVGA
jgi:hypothetical protein